MSSRPCEETQRAYQISRCLYARMISPYSVVVTADSTFNWLPFGWAFAAACLVMAVVLGRRWWIKRERKLRNERSPLKTKLLRPAGYSCFCRMDEVFEKLLSTTFGAVGAGVVAVIWLPAFGPVLHGLIVGQFTFAQLWATPNSYLLFVYSAISLAALIWCLRDLRLIFKLEDEMRNWRLGARGEQAVAENLADPKLAAAGYRAFHDVPGDGEWNIDHVVVGPAGLLVIETKARVRRKSKGKQPEHTVRYDGQSLQFPWGVDDRAVRQVEANARWVREKLAPYSPDDLLIQPVIAVPGWYVESLGNYPVKAMNEGYLVAYLAGMPRRFTPEQLKGVIGRLDDMCRTVEF